MSDKLNTCVIGLGSIGWGAGVSLLREGFPTIAVDVRAEALERFEAEGGASATSPAEGAAAADLVLIFVVNAEQTETVLFGENGAVAAAKPGTTFMIGVTMPPSAMADICARLEAAGMVAIDAPTSGGSLKAADGETTLMASGPDAAFEGVMPALEAFTGRIYRLGDTCGQGSRVKMINQLLAGVHIAAMAEAMTLGAKVGVDLGTLYEVITGSAGNSWMFENRGTHVVNGDYTAHSAVDIFVKDLGIVASEAGDGCPTPLASTALALFKEASAAGLGRQDDAAVAKILAEKAGVKLPGVEA
ncbi:L-threonate dehydrogenase [Tropicimonas sp. TH_r6]|uniref:L-threonate dehydrogenase n=1 Tax=Tropicimonas sp. TH_r6 TaxID=3082085 RepID=UPI0029549F12|nr:L-threonate dehydrogenase [Tropicimonas sp. TH_r6]MDV7141112.1 L-threonate dehydrogenase [Tropicimonas sp. TH_r6]